LRHYIRSRCKALERWRAGGCGGVCLVGLGVLALLSTRWYGGVPGGLRLAIGVLLLLSGSILWFAVGIRGFLWCSSVYARCLRRRGLWLQLGLRDLRGITLELWEVPTFRHVLLKLLALLAFPGSLLRFFGAAVTTTSLGFLGWSRHVCGSAAG